MMTAEFWLQFAVIVGACAVVPGYVCRLGMLHVRLHKASFISLHLAWCGATVAAGIHGYERAAGTQDVLCIAGAAAWLIFSLRTWRDGVPAYAWRVPPTVQQQ